MKRATVLLLAVALTGCTAVDYTAPGFPQAAADHQSIAVLPVEMIFQGKAPKGLTAEDIWQIEEGESLAFQASLYNYLLDRSSPQRRRPVRVAIQPIETTNQLLGESGLAIRDTWVLPADELAEILGVDAVVRIRVRKTRYLSDLASFGIAVGVHAVLEALEEDHLWLLPWGPRTHDIYAEGELIEARSGTLLWKVAVNRDTDWSRPANDVIRGVTRKLAKKFPYRGEVATG